MYNLISIETWVNSSQFKIYKQQKINCLTSKTFNTLLNMIHNDLYELTLDKSMPSRFIAVLLCFSDDINVNVAMKEWKTHSIHENICSNCICSHIIDKNIFIENKINGNILVTGNDCIQKFSFSKESKKEARKQIKTKQKYKCCTQCKNYNLDKQIETTLCEICQIYKQCNECNLYNVLKSNDNDICTKCEINKLYKSCKKCNNKNIQKISEKDICESCDNLEKQLITIYKRNINSQCNDVLDMNNFLKWDDDYHQCIKCNKFKIFINRDKICDNCLLKDHKQCIQCYYFNIDRNSNKKICNNCIQYNIKELHEYCNKFQNNRYNLIYNWILSKLK